MVEKELLKLQEHQLDFPTKQVYFYWLVIEYYLLRGGVSDGGGRQIEGYERLRELSKGRREKAYFDCQMWLAFDRELKTELNAPLWASIAKLPRVQVFWLDQALLQIEERAIACDEKITPKGEWMGGIYHDEQYDFRVRRMLKSAETLTPFVKPMVP